MDRPLFADAWWVREELRHLAESKRTENIKMKDTLHADLAGHCMRLEAEIARLNHQHANDEAANRMLSEACERQRAGIAILRSHTIKKCAALFSGGVRNRELYVNDVEEMILGLLKG